MSLFDLKFCLPLDRKWILGTKLLTSNLNVIFLFLIINIQEHNSDFYLLSDQEDTCVFLLTCKC